MRIAICDDDALCCSELQAMMQAYCEAQAQQEIAYSIYDSAVMLLDAVQRTGDFDIYLLDIVMPGTDGILLGKQLREMGSSSRILYLTSSAEYAIEAYAVNAYNYLLKPIKKEAFFDAMDKVVASIASRREKTLIVKTAETSLRLSFDSILYAELNQRTVHYHLTSRKIVESLQIRTTFSEAVAKLAEDQRFVMCGASLIANLHHIQLVEKDALLFSDGSRVYIPRKICGAVRSLWNDFWLNKEEET